MQVELCDCLLDRLIAFHFDAFLKQLRSKQGASSPILACQKNLGHKPSIRESEKG